MDAHLVKDDLDVVAERLEGRNDHPVLKGLRDEDDVLAQHRFEGLMVEPQVLKVGQGREILQHPHHVLQTRVGGSNPDLGQFLVRKNFFSYSNATDGQWES